MSSIALVIPTLSVTVQADRRCSRQEGGCGYRGVGITPTRRGIKNGDTLVSFDPYHTGFCGRGYETLGWKAERNSFEDNAAELFGIVLFK